MNLNIEIKSNAAIVTNVKEIASYYLEELKKYEGCVASIDTLKDDKQACANINKLKKFVGDQRIVFDKAVKNQPDVLAVHNALKSIEDACDAVRDPYWKSCKAIEDSNKEPEERFFIRVNFNGVTAKRLEDMKKKWAKDGISFDVIGMDIIKEEK